MALNVKDAANVTVPLKSSLDGLDHVAHHNVDAVVPGTGAANLGKAEDAAHASGDVGVVALAVRRDTAASSSGTDGDYSTLNVNALGRLHTTGVIESSALPSGAATEATLANVATQTTAAAILAKFGDLIAAGADALANTLDQMTVGAFGYFFNGTTWDRMRGDTTNGLDVDVTRSALPTGAASESTLAAISATLTSMLAVLTVSDAFVTSITAANTSANTFGSQVVKAPVHITIATGMTGTLTIDDGDAGAMVLRWDNTNGQHNPTGVFYVANLSQLRYTFSVNAGTESFSLSTGI